MEYVLPERNRSGPGCKSVPDRIPHPELKVEMILGVSPRHMILSLRWRWTKGPHTLRTPRHPRPLAKFLYYTTMSALKQGEFVGSLDCGTTCVTFTLMTSYSSIMFICYTALRDSLSLINMRMQSLRDSSSFHSIIPSLGASLVFSNVSPNLNSPPPVAGMNTMQRKLWTSAILVLTKPARTWSLQAGPKIASRSSVSVYDADQTQTSLLTVVCGHKVSPINERPLLHGVVRLGNHSAVLLCGMIAVPRMWSHTTNTNSRPRDSSWTVPSEREMKV